MEGVAAPDNGAIVLHEVGEDVTATAVDAEGVAAPEAINGVAELSAECVGVAALVDDAEGVAISDAATHAVGVPASDPEATSELVYTA